MAAVQPTAIQRLAQELKTFHWHYNPDGDDDKSKASAKQEQKIRRIIAKCKPQDVWDLWEQVAPAKFPVPFGLKAKKKDKTSKAKSGLPLHPSKAFQRRQELELPDPSGEVARWNMISALVMLAGELGCTVPKLTKEQIKGALGSQLKQVTPELIAEAEAERLSWRANSLQDLHVLDVFVGYVQDGMTTPEQIRELFGQVAAGKILSEVSRRKDRAKFEQATSVRRNGSPSDTGNPGGEVKGKTIMKAKIQNPVKKTTEPGKGRGARCLILGYSASSVVQWMGTQGFSFETARTVCNKLGASELKDSSIKTALTDCKNEKYARIAGLNAEEIATVNEAAGKATKAAKPPKSSMPAKAPKKGHNAASTAKPTPSSPKQKVSAKPQARGLKNGKRSK